MVKGFKLFLLVINLPLYFLSLLIPKTENIWVFGAWFGKKYSDNPKYLFEYINSQSLAIKAVWISKEKNIVTHLRGMGYKSYQAFSLKGYYFTARAKIIIISSGKEDVNKYMLSKKSLIINLWHGTPLKKIYYDDKYHPININSLKKGIFPFLNVNYSSFIAPSEDVQEKMCSAFRKGKKYIYLTGYPRLDGLSKTTPVLKFDESIKIIGIYMPTFRNSNILINQINISFSSLDIYLQEKDLLLYIKLHEVDINNPNLKIENFNNIKLLNLDEPKYDIYNYLNTFDFLLTDYSSVYFDYLTLNKPIIFFPFDFDDYIKKDRELYYNYNEVTPGPKVKTTNELIKAIEDVFTGKDLYEKKRVRINKIFNNYSCDGNSERVFEAIINNENLNA